MQFAALEATFLAKTGKQFRHFVLFFILASFTFGSSHYEAALAYQFDSSSTEKVVAESVSNQVLENLFPADLVQISTTDAFSPYVLLVDKSERKIHVYQNDNQSIKRIQTFPADIGKLDGNKQKRDDSRTPEGIYFLEKQLNPPEIPFDQYGELAFTTNYPNYFDVTDGKTGSGIWLHAIPDTVPLTRGSRGCVVVRNDSIKELQKYIRLGETPILIFDKVEYASKDRHEIRQKEVSAFIESWRQSWESQSVEDYMSYYSTNFKGSGMTYNQWRRHKSKLTKNYNTISVQFDQPYILLNRDQLVFKTLQTYESDKHRDYGIKTIYARKTGDSYKIINEEWVASSNTGKKLFPEQVAKDRHPKRSFLEK